MVGGVPVGGGAPVSVQSMIKAPPHDATAILRQVRALERAGCEIIRLAVPDADAARVFGAVKEKARAPLVADIHFNKNLALLALEAGADCVRVNPGTLGTAADFRAVVSAARRAGRPLRIGVNAGSLPRDIEKRYGAPAPEALVEAALRYCEAAEKAGLRDYKVSLKASGVLTTIDANRAFSKISAAPLHIGITESGGEGAGGLRSAVGLGVLLAGGIGDTVRVSLTAPPVREVEAAWHILGALNIRGHGPRVTSCPTCGRTQTDTAPIVAAVERRVRGVAAPITIAVMGCPVNGPGEARMADIGVAMGPRNALIFKKGAVIKKVRPENALKELMIQIDGMLDGKK